MVIEVVLEAGWQTTMGGRRIGACRLSEVRVCVRTRHEESVVRQGPALEVVEMRLQ